jgi:hypothetical protein
MTHLWIYLAGLASGLLGGLALGWLWWGRK